MSMPLPIDSESKHLAQYLSWARHNRVSGTFIPLISYRGHARDDWSLLPSSCRQRLPVGMVRRFEKEVIGEFRNRFELENFSDLEVLAYAQHHGAPTRLLDWTRNPIVALWFAVGASTYDNMDGVVYQMVIPDHSKAITPSFGDFSLERAESCGCGAPVHVFSGPVKVQRTDRQGSVFTITTFKNGLATTPLDEIVFESDRIPVYRITIRASQKIGLRRLLCDLGLDAHSIYGGPDAFGRSLAAMLDHTGLCVDLGSPPKPDPSIPEL